MASDLELQGRKVKPCSLGCIKINLNNYARTQTTEERARARAARARSVADGPTGMLSGAVELY